MPRLTPAQDRQSRAQPPLRGPPPPPTAPSASSSKGKSRAPNSAAAPTPTEPRIESLEDHDRKEHAARVLDSWEMLARIGISRGESIPQTRLRYEKVFAGIADEDDGAHEDEWEDVNEVEEKDALEPVARSPRVVVGSTTGSGSGSAKAAKRGRAGKEKEGNGSGSGRKGRRD